MAITLQDKAQFYQKLATGVKAGLTLQQIVDAQLLPGRLVAKNASLKRQIDKGVSFTRAFQHAGLVAPWEAQLIHIGETSGRLEAVFARLDGFFSTKVRQLGHIKSKLRYPMLTLLVAVTVLPLPAVFGGLMTVTDYVVQVIISLTVMSVLYHLLIVKPFQAASVGAFNPLLIKSLGFVGESHFLRLQFDVSYMDLLTLCLESGMDAVQSMRLLQGNFTQKRIRKQHAFAISKVDKGGCSLTEALGGQGIVKHPQVIAFLATSEASGTLHSELREFLQRKRQEVDATTDYWLRRISVLVYICAMAYASLKLIPLLLSTLVG